MRVEFAKREEVVAASSLKCREASAQPVRAIDYYFQSVSAGRWIGTEDLEFRADETLSGDEVAQAIFLLSGGVANQTCGEVGGFCVEYDARRPAVLRLHARHGCVAHGLPRIYHRL